MIDVMPILMIIIQFLSNHFDVIIETVWTFSWLFAISVGIWHYRDVKLDNDAVIQGGLHGGYEIIANGNLRTIRLLITIAMLNLIPGIIGLLVPGYIPSSEFIKFVNLICLILAAILTTSIILFKRLDRLKWEKLYRKIHNDKEVQ